MFHFINQTIISDVYLSRIWYPHKKNNKTANTRTKLQHTNKATLHKNSTQPAC